MHISVTKIMNPAINGSALCCVVLSVQHSTVQYISCLGVSPSLHRPGAGAYHLSWPGPGDSYPDTTEGHPAPV